MNATINSTRQQESAARRRLWSDIRRHLIAWREEREDGNVILGRIERDYFGRPEGVQLGSKQEDESDG